MNSKSSSTFLSYYNLESISIIDSSIPKSKYVAIDLSTSNSELKYINVDCHKSWENFIRNYLQNNEAKVAFGGYLEKRDLYKRSDSFSSVIPGKQRNIHLGLDLWVDAGTKVLAAFDGEIHSFGNNASQGDYGPTIILKHNISGIEFHTLYGHLSMDSLDKLKVGDKIEQGETIGHIGIAEVNGDYAPHLHFQVINDMQGKKGDYPGVSSIEDLDFYKKNCPNPGVILGFDSNVKVVKTVLEKELNL